MRGATDKGWFHRSTATVRGHGAALLLVLLSGVVVGLPSQTAAQAAPGIGDITSFLRAWRDYRDQGLLDPTADLVPDGRIDHLDAVAFLEGLLQPIAPHRPEDLEAWVDVVLAPEFEAAAQQFADRLRDSGEFSHVTFSAGTRSVSFLTREGRPGLFLYAGDREAAEEGQPETERSVPQPASAVLSPAASVRPRPSALPSPWSLSVPTEKVVLVLSRETPEDVQKWVKPSWDARADIAEDLRRAEVPETSIVPPFDLVPTTVDRLKGSGILYLDCHSGVHPGCVEHSIPADSPALSTAVFTYLGFYDEDDEIPHAVFHTACIGLVHKLRRYGSPGSMWIDYLHSGKFVPAISCIKLGPGKTLALVGVFVPLQWLVEQASPLAENALAVADGCSTVYGAAWLASSGAQALVGWTGLSSVASDKAESDARFTERFFGYLCGAEDVGLPSACPLRPHSVQEAALEASCDMGPRESGYGYLTFETRSDDHLALRPSLSCGGFSGGFPDIPAEVALGGDVPQGSQAYLEGVPLTRKDIGDASLRFFLPDTPRTGYIWVEDPRGWRSNRLLLTEYKLNGTFHLGTPYFSQAELRVEALNREVVPSWWDHVGPGSWELATYPAGFDFSPALAEEFTLSWTLRGDYTDPSGVRYVTDCGGSASGADAVRHFLMLALVYDPSSKKSEWAMNYIDMPWTYVQYRYPGDKGTLCEGNIRVEPRIVDPAHPFLPCDSERNPASGAVTGATVSWIRPFKGQDMLVQFSYPDIAPDPALDPAEPR